MWIFNGFAIRKLNSATVFDRFSEICLGIKAMIRLILHVKKKSSMEVLTNDVPLTANGLVLFPVFVIYAQYICWSIVVRIDRRTHWGCSHSAKSV